MRALLTPYTPRPQNDVQMVLRSTVVMMFVQNVDEIAFDAGATPGGTWDGMGRGRRGEAGKVWGVGCWVLGVG